MAGNVSFVEIGTTDTDRSRAFFEEIFGWQFHPMPQGGGWFQTPSMRVGFHSGDPSLQMYTFFDVPNLDEAIVAVRAAGGEADGAAAQEPGFGRFSSCRDPQGVRFGLHQKAAI